jgi:hypothetical protein
MLDGKCSFGGGVDGFSAFGAGRTLPTTVKGCPQLLVTAVGTVLEGFGKFQGHGGGAYVYCGTLAPDRGFTGNLMIRIIDSQKTLRAEAPLPPLQRGPSPEPGVTYIVLRGEAIPSDTVSPNIGPDGKPIGLIVQQGIRLQYLDCAVAAQEGLRTTDKTGPWVGRITAYVTFDPASASGASFDPVPFTAYDVFVFFDPGGGPIGGFTADSNEGRVFNTSVSGQPAIRFGGVGAIRDGTGPFQEMEGMMTDNSLVVFSPHVSASVYVLRVRDPGRRFRLASGAG